MKNLILLTLMLIPFSVSSEVATFGIIGDAGHWNAHSKSVRDSLLVDKVFDLILPGDNIYDLNLNYHDVWSNWTEKGFRFPVVAIGNHTKGYTKEMAYFSMAHEYYSKRTRDVHFIVLNSDNNLTANEQASFLRSELEASADKFIFVVFHHPPFTLRHQWQEKKEFQLAVRPVLMEYKDKITALIVGHDHIASLVQMDTLPVVVSGAVFESFHIPRINTSLDGLSIKTKWSSAGGYFWTRLDIDNEKNLVWVNFVGTTNERVKCSIRIFPRPLLVKNNCL